MSYKIRIIEEAESEIKARKDWYETQQLGLGEDFSHAVTNAIESLLDDRVDQTCI